MAATTSVVITGDWSVGATWSLGVAPTSVDDVTIAKNHTVTIDNTAAVALTVTLANGTTGADVGGILKNSVTADTKLTLQRNIITTKVATAAYMSGVLLDISSTNSYKCELEINASDSTTTSFGRCLIDGNYLFKGFVRTRHSVINSALTANSTLSVVVADATGWAVGDKLIFATTSAYNATPRTDIVTIATITAGGGTTATITWTDGVGTGGAVLYDHATGCPVGNFTSNMRVIGQDLSTVYSSLYITSIAGQQNQDCHIDSVEFVNCTQSVVLNALSQADNTTARHKSIKRCSFFGHWDYAITLGYLSFKPERNFNVFYSAASNAAVLNSGNLAGKFGGGADEDYLVLRSNLGLSYAYPDQVQRRHKISGVTVSSSGFAVLENIAGQSGANVEDCEIWSCLEAPRFHSTMTLLRCKFNSKVFANATAGNGQDIALRNSAKVTAIDCHVPSSFVLDGVLSVVPVSLLLNNRDGDAAVQEYYQYQSNTSAAVRRSTATTSRSTSSMEFTLNSTTAQDYSFDVLAKAGQTIRLLILVRKSGTPAYGASTLPKVTISGLGITPVVTTMAAGTAADTWETLVTEATNTGSADGNLTVTLTAQTSVAGAKAYFAGLPIAPFVTRVRHYAYLFDESIPTRTKNITVTQPSADTVSAYATAEATAAALTGIIVTWGASLSTTDLGADRTFQILYDYSQAQACLNVASALPLTGAGVAGSPSLFASGALTTTGFTLNGAGSISMGSLVLTASLPWVYTYTGGTFSQAAAVPIFSGGTLAIGAAGTFTYNQAASTLLQVTPTAPSTYNLGSSTFVGTLTVNNLAAHAITVEVPSGTTTSDAGNIGGAITFSAPLLYQSVTVTGITTTSRVQIYDTTNSVELSNSVPGATSVVWTDSVAAAGNRAIRVRIADVITTTAKEFIEANIGTCGVTSGTKDISYLATQVSDTTYTSNAINGPATYAASGVTFTDAATDLVVCNIAGGSVSWKSIYAWFVHWNHTATGIANDFTYVDAPDTANYLLSGMKVRNTNANPLTITGGYGRDATTGAVADVMDRTGSTGNLYPSPDHVVAYATGSALTGAENAQLMGIPLTPLLASNYTVPPTAAANATAVWAKTLP